MQHALGLARRAAGAGSSVTLRYYADYTLLYVAGVQHAPAFARPAAGACRVSGVGFSDVTLLQHALYVRYVSVSVTARCYGIQYMQVTVTLPGVEHEERILRAEPYDWKGLGREGHGVAPQLVHVADSARVSNLSLTSLSCFFSS